MTEFSDFEVRLEEDHRHDSSFPFPHLPLFDGRPSGKSDSFNTEIMNDMYLQNVFNQLKEKKRNLL